MGRFTPWPSEIRDAITAEVACGVLRTSEIYARIQSGQLEGLTRAYPDLPIRTFYAYLADARAEQRRESAPKTDRWGGRSPLEVLALREGERMEAEERAREEAERNSEGAA